MLEKDPQYFEAKKIIGLQCLTPFSTIFQLCHGNNFKTDRNINNNNNNNNSNNNEILNDDAFIENKQKKNFFYVQ